MRLRRIDSCGVPLREDPFRAWRLEQATLVLPLLRAAVGLGFATPQAKSKAENRVRLLVSCVQKKSKAEKCLRLLVSCVQKRLRQLVSCEDLGRGLSLRRSAWFAAATGRDSHG